MIELRIVSGERTVGEEKDCGLKSVIKTSNLIVECCDTLQSWQGANQDRFFLLGDIVGFRQADGSISNSSQLTLQLKCLEDPLRVSEVEGRFIVVKVTTSGECKVWSDQFGRVDIYWQTAASCTVLATRLDLLPVGRDGGLLDVVGTAHALTVYGSRPAKQHTIYSNVRRLGVNQQVSLKAGKVDISNINFMPAVTGQYKERDLHRYSELFLEAVRARASVNGNVVSLSSGWDSTSILAALVHLFGSSKVRAVIGRMRYSDRSGIVNQFEIDRAKAVADYFGVNLEIIDQDYCNFTPEQFYQVQGYLRSNQLSTVTALSQWRISQAVAARNSGEVFFTGEASDGAHNLGFSQFVTIFHSESQAFREYADKMASYLFGPTFFSQLEKGTHEKDPVWQLFQARNSKLKFDPPGSGKQAITSQFLASFFLRGGRMPLYSLDNAAILTPHGREVFEHESIKTYFDVAIPQVNSQNLYSWLLQLYHSFHWQSATVLSRDYAADAHGVRVAHPFMDAGILEFLSAMPESWGRGLDFNPTKYPLKWTLRNKIDYPYHLQVGPHSYLYDVRPGFSLLGELLHASSLKTVFNEALKQGVFIDRLDSHVFDRAYIDGLAKRYLKGEELLGQEQTDLGSLAMHSAVGVYGK
jgi:hypothetical protein